MCDGLFSNTPRQVKKNYEALRQRQEEESTAQSSPSRGRDDSKWVKESQEATRELLKVKDRLIEVERNVRINISRPASHGHSCRGSSSSDGQQMLCRVRVFVECHSSSRETGCVHTVKAAGVSEQSSPGSDFSSAASDGVSPREQHNSTNTERQTSGDSNSHFI